MTRNQIFDKANEFYHKACDAKAKQAEAIDDAENDYWLAVYKTSLEAAKAIESLAN